MNYMKQVRGLGIAVVLLIVIVPASVAQRQREDPKPQLPAKILGSQLIVWSHLQNPQPVPQPLPHTSKGQPSAAQPANSESITLPTGEADREVDESDLASGPAHNARRHN
jgi:hypothetical protein